MKRIYCVLAALGMLCAGQAPAAPADQPVFIYFYARIGDHVNLDMSEDRLRHILPMTQKYRQMHPEAHISTTILFSGAVSRALQQRNASTHILDFVKDYMRRGIIEVGYDGTDEPTYSHRPTLVFTDNQSPEDCWRLRQTVATQFLAEARDPLTGAPAAGNGGLKEMQAVFGPATCLKGLDLALKEDRAHGRYYKKGDTPGPIPGGVLPIPGVYTEVGGDTETLQALRPYNMKAIIFGIPAVNPAELPGFSEAVGHFGDMLSPIPETAPEIYWQDDVLRISERSREVRAVKASAGVESLKTLLSKVGRDKVHVIQVELGSPEAYLRPAFVKTAPNAPMKYAYDHPQSPKLPADDMLAPAEVTAAWSKEDELLSWLSGDFFAANSGSRAVDAADLKKMAGASIGFTVSTASLQAQLVELMNKWHHDNFTPSYLKVDDHYLSLAEWFQVMTDELAEFHRAGKLPQSVKVVKVRGPLYLPDGHGPNIGDITVADLAALCADIAGPLHDDRSSEIPKNAIPFLLKVNGKTVNAAQMLRLMAQALADPAPAKAIPIKMTYMLDEAGGAMPKSRPIGYVGFVWTLKPAPLQPALLK
jgi:hypothetical protein